MAGLQEVSGKHGAQAVTGTISEFLVAKGLTPEEAYIIRQRFNSWMHNYKQVHPEPVVMRSRLGHIYDFSSLEYQWVRYVAMLNKFGGSNRI